MKTIVSAVIALSVLVGIAAPPAPPSTPRASTSSSIARPSNPNSETNLELLRTTMVNHLHPPRSPPVGPRRHQRSPPAPWTRAESLPRAALIARPSNPKSSRNQLPEPLKENCHEDYQCIRAILLAPLSVLAASSQPRQAPSTPRASTSSSICQARVPGLLPIGPREGPRASTCGLRRFLSGRWLRRPRRSADWSAGSAALILTRFAAIRHEAQTAWAFALHSIE